MSRDAAALDTALTTVETVESFPRPNENTRITAREFTSAEVAALVGAFPGLDNGTAAQILRYRDPGDASIWLNLFLTEFAVDSVGALYSPVLLRAIPLYAMYTTEGCPVTQSGYGLGS